MQEAPALSSTVSATSRTGRAGPRSPAPFALARSVLQTVRHILNHPLNADRPYAALKRWLAWQLAGRLMPGTVLVPFIDDAVLTMRHGDRGITINHYCGLGELAEMGFVLHFLRPGELFLDVGANLGVYAVLASRVVGARTIAFEPAPDTFCRLRANIDANGLGGLVDPRCLAVSSKPGSLWFSTGAGPMNAVVADDYPGPRTHVACARLDDALDRDQPIMMKMDVEGHERAALAGAARLLASPSLQAMIVEIGRGVERDSAPVRDTVAQVESAGFVSVDYDARSRTLSHRADADRSGNFIFVRDVAAATARVRAAPRRRGPWFDI